MAQSRRSVKQWNSLSEAQRKRYISAGRTGTLNGTPGLTPAEVRSYYVGGGSLQAARGKHTPKPSAKFAPPKAALRAAQAGNATNKQLAQLKNWQQKRSPQWVRRSTGLSEDTAAIVVEAGLSPAYWRNVRVFPREDGSYDVYVTSKRGGPERKFTLPDEASVLEVVGLVDKVNNKGFDQQGINYLPTTVFRGYRREAESGGVKSAPATKRGGALPRKKK